MSKTEKVARAMAAAMGFNPNGVMRPLFNDCSVGPTPRSFHPDVPAWEYFQDMAKVVIAAMEVEKINAS